MAQGENKEFKKPSLGDYGTTADEVTNDSVVPGTTVKDALDNLAAAGGSIPFTTKGDLASYDGKAMAIVAAGADGYVLKARAAAANGIEWAKTIALAAKGDIISSTGKVDAIVNVGADGMILSAKASEAAGLLWKVNPVDLLAVKGDLLGYDGKAAAIVKLGIGADGKILTANSAVDIGFSWETAPTATPRTFSYIVGATGDYASVSLLLAAHPAPKSVFIQDGTYDESGAPVVIPATTAVVCESLNVIMDMGAGSLTISAAASWKGGVVRGTVAVADLLIVDGNYAKVEGVKVISQAVGDPVAQQWLVNAMTGHLDVILRDIVLEFAGDYANEGGIKYKATSGRIENTFAICSVTGVNTKLMDITSEQCVVDGVHITGLAVNGSAFKAIGSSGRVTIKGVGSDNNALGSIGATLTECEVDSCTFITLDGSGNKVSKSHIMTVTPSANTPRNYFSDCDIEALRLVNASKNIFTGCRIRAQSIGAVAIEAMFSACKFDTAVDLTGDEITMSGCEFNNSLTLTGNLNRVTGGYVANGVAVAGDYNGLVGARVGAKAGGGTGSVVVSPGATSNQIVGCMTDAAITDGGTTTINIANTTY